MAAEDRMFYTIAGCVLLMAAAVFGLVSVAPSARTSAPAPVAVASSEAAPSASPAVPPAPARAETPPATAARGKGGKLGSGWAEAAEASWLEDGTGGDSADNGLEWLAARLEGNAMPGDAGGIGATLARVEATITAVAEGELPEGSPAWRLPWDKVLVRDSSDGRAVLAAGTFRHYDAWVGEIEQLDLERVAEIVSMLDAGPAPGLESSLRRAVRHATALEIPAGPAEMESHVTRWVFADDAHRDLSPIQKHLLLMGPANAQAVQARLRELDRLLGDCSTDPQPALDIDDGLPSSGAPLLASNEAGEPDASVVGGIAAE